MEFQCPDAKEILQGLYVRGLGLPGQNGIMEYQVEDTAECGRMGLVEGLSV